MEIIKEVSLPCFISFYFLITLMDEILASESECF